MKMPVFACSQEIANPRPLYSPHIDYSEETQGELAVFFAARELRTRYGDAAFAQRDHFKTDSASDLLEVALLLKEAGLLKPASPIALASHLRWA